MDASSCGLRPNQIGRLRLRVAAAAIGVTMLAALVAFDTAAQAPASSTARSAAPWESHPTWSADGRRIALETNRAGNLDIVIRDLQTGKDTPLTTDPADDEEPNWEPAGECIAFRSLRDGGGIFVQCLDGPARRVAADGREPRWAPDGSRLLYTTQRDGVPALYVVTRDGGEPVAILASLTSTLVGTIRAVWTSHGRRVAVIGTHPTHGVGLWVLPADASAPPQAPAVALSRTLLRIDAKNPPAFEMSIDGGQLFLPGRENGKATLFRITLDLNAFAMRSGPEPVARWTGEQVVVSLSPSAARLASAVGTRGTRVFVFPFDTATGQIGVAEPQVVGPDEGVSGFPDFSPDGTLLLYTVARQGRPTELRLWSPVTRADVLLLADGAYRFGPRWSPTGTALIYRWQGSSNGQTVSAIRSIDLIAKRESAVTTTGPGLRFTPFAFSNDGQQILATELKWNDTIQTGGLVSLPSSSAPAAERKVKRLFSADGFSLWQARVSPNGRWILVNLHPSDQTWSSIAVVPADGGPYRRLTTDTDAWDDKPRWSPDGRTVYFLSRRSGEFELWRLGFDPETGEVVGPANRISALTTPRRHVLRDVAVLDLGLSASRLAVPIEETTSVLQFEPFPATMASTPSLATCVSTEPLADSAVPAETEGLTLPIVVESTPPRWPERGLPKGTGSIVIETLIDADGTARPVCALQPLDRAIEKEFMAAVRRWRFKAGRLNGKPVRTLMTLRWTYRIPE